MASFRRLAERLGGLATIPSRISAPVAVRFNELLRAEFDSGSDPYGKPWAPLKPSTVRKKGHDLVLIETNKLAAETIAIPRGGAGIELITLPYGAFHQTGTKWMVPREILPDRADLPLTWQAVIREEYSAAFGKAMAR